MQFEHPISIAPMMDRTDRHFRFMARKISRRTLLYTEMVTANAILFGGEERHLNYNPEEHPVVLQLGGDDPVAMTKAALAGKRYGYDEININVGCPSDRVKNGNFGACLMKTPDHVAELVKTMQDALDIPVTVKHRIGVDDMDSYDHMAHFVGTIAETGCNRFSVHARKAWLQGLSPKENREIPPLRYEDVYRLKRDFPNLIIEINGGVRTMDDAAEHLKYVDAVMIGRAAYETPWMFAEVDSRFYGENTQPTLEELIAQMTEYASQEIEKGIKLSAITRHMLTLFNGRPGSRAWRRHLSDNAWREGTKASLITQAYDLMQEHAA